MIFKIKIFLVFLLFIVSTCERRGDALPEDIPACGTTTYDLSDIYFTKDDTLYFSIKFHFILSDSTETVDTSSMSDFLKANNAFYSHARIQFEIDDFCQTIDEEESTNMPNFKKYGTKHGEGGAINIFVYNNKQPFYTGEKENVVGVAGGIGSTIIAIRSNFVRSLTATHELGHALGLLHIDTGGALKDTSDFTGDLVCDTPPSENLGQKVNYLCNYIGSENLTEEQKEILSKNVMSWVYLHCRELITDGQIARIKWMVQNNADLRACIKRVVSN